MVMPAEHGMSAPLLERPLHARDAAVRAARAVGGVVQQHKLPCCRAGLHPALDTAALSAVNVQARARVCRWWAPSSYGAGLATPTCSLSALVPLSSVQSLLMTNTSTSPLPASSSTPSSRGSSRRLAPACARQQQMLAVCESAHPVAGCSSGLRSQSTPSGVGCSTLGRCRLAPGSR